MPSVNFQSADGAVTTIEIEIGNSVMRGARDNSVDGIDADCGGVCACATCHVYVAPDWIDRVGPAGTDESEMLDCVNDPRPNSRLSCQIAMSQELEGLTLILPESQR
ncbi:2Fe-2S iron-sulfur cluster-binding protein [Sphingopyxis sp. GW247-27LB]|uniref:2Fe-2S iron-sulfur cluster-binding protein n=1 Tax=Sphingopyxis sp. GW247-27LB TaxID=2012632 RepID=UPI000BA57FFB|nr:2Fe-2S iron-sulfur cluster-binding protein [Sphingopyxis sp. GW247-27LB]PAL22041.1 (2Fe-2S)-binding protein [Sphingopyxis sp. GW247-27LB]